MAGLFPGHPRLHFGWILRRGCPGYLSRRRASRFCPGHDANYFNGLL